MSIWVDVNGWPFPPTILLGCLLAEGLYLRGWGRLLDRAQPQKQRVVWLWRGAAFIGAIFVLLLASSAPVDTLSGRYFWVHMIQHLLLLVVMPPLLLAGAPLLPWWHGLPDWTRRLLRSFAASRLGHALAAIGRWCYQPAVACVLLLVGTWVWHWPPLYDFALNNDFIHDWGEHLTFMVVSTLFWAQIIPSPPLQPHASYLGRMGCMGFAVVQNLVLAMVIGFAPGALYAPYAHIAMATGLPAVQDQQIGAGIMWTFGDVPLGIAISILVQRWLATHTDEPETSLPAHVKAENNGR